MEKISTSEIFVFAIIFYIKKLFWIQLKCGNFRNWKLGKLEIGKIFRSPSTPCPAGRWLYCVHCSIRHKKRGYSKWRRGFRWSKCRPQSCLSLNDFGVCQTPMVTVIPHLMRDLATTYPLLSVIPHLTVPELVEGCVDWLRYKHGWQGSSAAYFTRLKLIFCPWIGFKV
jgi:hypothetical protein